MQVMKKVFKFKKDMDEFDIPKNVQGIIPDSPTFGRG